MCSTFIYIFLCIKIIIPSFVKYHVAVCVCVCVCWLAACFMFSPVVWPYLDPAVLPEYCGISHIVFLFIRLLNSVIIVPYVSLADIEAPALCRTLGQEQAERVRQTLLRSWRVRTLGLLKRVLLFKCTYFWWGIVLYFVVTLPCVLSNIYCNSSFI